MTDRKGLAVAGAHQTKDIPLAGCGGPYLESYLLLGKLQQESCKVEASLACKMKFYVIKEKGETQKDISLSSLQQQEEQHVAHCPVQVREKLGIRSWKSIL